MPAPFRRSELVSLDVADIEFARAGPIVTLRKSKTDQEGRSRRLEIPYGSFEQTCPVRSLQAWLESARITDGPAFRSLDRFQRLQPGRLSDKAVAVVVKQRAKAVGLDPARYAGHSLRAGVATSAAAAGRQRESLCRQPLNVQMSSQDPIGLIADLDGKGVDDILGYNINTGRLQVSIGGRTAWQPLASLGIADVIGGVFVGHFDRSRGAQVLAIGAPEGSVFNSGSVPRSGHIFSRSTGGSFVPYGKYAY